MNTEDRNDICYHKLLLCPKKEKKQMKRIIAFVLLFQLAVVMCGLGNACPAKAEQLSGVVAKVTTKRGTLNLRAKPSFASTVIEEIPNGSCLLVLEEGNEWCLCQWSGKTGYCSAEFLTILQDADIGILNYRVLHRGDHGKDVLALKTRLQELGYIRSGSTLTEVYNDILEERIILFQNQIGVAEDGIASQELQNILFSDRAPECTQTLPQVRSQVKKEDNGLKKRVCGCCMGEGCECCGYKGWIYY